MKIGVTALAAALVLGSSWLVSSPAQANGCVHAEFPGGDGTSGNPFQVADAGDLNYIQSYAGCWGYYFLQTADISMSGVTWTGAIGSGANNFIGSFNGNGYRITGLTINNTSITAGLFGVVGSAGVVRNVAIVDVDVTAQMAGGLVGDNRGTVSNSYSTGTVGATSYAGGLVGSNDGTITNSYSTAIAIAVLNYAGGLVGSQDSSGSIANSYATGTATAANFAGGLEGDGHASSTVSNSFRSGSPNSGDGTYATSAEMQDITTFSDAGWSISAGGSGGTTWGICAAVNGGYPFINSTYASDPCGSASGSAGSSSPQFTLTLDAPMCSSSSPAGSLGQWIKLPAANQCAAPETNTSLLGWATIADFPRAIAQRQVTNGWGAYELFDASGALIAVFIPAGGATLLTGSAPLYPIWSA